MKAHFLNVIDQIFIIKFLATFEITGDTNHIHDDAAMWLLPHFIHGTHANTLNSRTYAKNSLPPFNASVRDRKPQSQKFLQTYLEVVSYLLKNYATDHAVAEYIASIVRYSIHWAWPCLSILMILSQSRAK